MVQSFVHALLEKFRSDQTQPQDSLTAFINFIEQNSSKWTVRHDASEYNNAGVVLDLGEGEPQKVSCLPTCKQERGDLDPSFAMDALAPRK